MVMVVLVGGRRRFDRGPRSFSLSGAAARTSIVPRTSTVPRKSTRLTHQPNSPSPSPPPKSPPEIQLPIEPNPPPFFPARPGRWHTYTSSTTCSRTASPAYLAPKYLYVPPSDRIKTSSTAKTPYLTHPRPQRSRSHQTPPPPPLPLPTGPQSSPNPPTRHHNRTHAHDHIPPPQPPMQRPFRCCDPCVHHRCL